ncbi:MAG: GNAT family N-acetyltransferase [Acidimicrobiales bacterium]
MLRGTTVFLRARHAADLPHFLTELYDDVDTHVLGSTTPWLPRSPDGDHLPFQLDSFDEGSAYFSICRLADAKLIGIASVWGIDRHNRRGNLGLSLFPEARGHGYGTDSVRIMVSYAFDTLGLHRLEIETLAINMSMQRVAEVNGFLVEGRRRDASWIDGHFEDDLIYSLLVTDREGSTH